MRYENLIWDFDGTLFDTYPPMCRDLQSAMAERGAFFTVEELVEQFTQSRETVLAYCGARCGMTAQEVDTIYRAYVAEHGQPEAKPFPHVEEILRAFQAAGGRNFVFTHRSESVHDYLAEAGLTQYFTDVVSAGKTFERKPSPAGNLYLLETHGCDKKSTMAVGDRDLDILAAKAAGIDACHFTKRQKAADADYCIDEMRQLYAIIGLAEE